MFFQSNANMTQKRKKQFVDRSVQGAILCRLLAYGFLFVITTGAFLYFVELLVGPPEEAAENMIRRHGPTALAFLALAPIFLRDLCKLTNRFAGPMVRLRQGMHDLAEGRQVAPIDFRENDFWKDLAIDFNRIAKRVQESESSFDAVTSLDACAQDGESVHA